MKSSLTLLTTEQSRLTNKGKKGVRIADSRVFLVPSPSVAESAQEFDTSRRRRRKLYECHLAVWSVLLLILLVAAAAAPAMPGNLHAQ